MRWVVVLKRKMEAVLTGCETVFVQKKDVLLLISRSYPKIGEVDHFPFKECLKLNFRLRARFRNAI